MSVQRNNDEKSEDNISGDVIWYLPPLEFFHVFVWSVTLLLAFGFGRILCNGHGNYLYCRTQVESNVFDNLSALLLMGIALCFFTGMHSSIRFNYLYGFTAETMYSGVLFLFSFFLTPVIWKGLDTTALKTLMFTSSGLGNSLLPLTMVIILFLFILGWHIYMAHKLGVLRVYLISRSLVFFYMLLNVLVCLTEKDIEIHVHHYQLGWFVALFGCFNHPISVVTLAFGTGLFVEGLSTFGADSMFVPLK